MARLAAVMLTLVALIVGGSASAAPGQTVTTEYEGTHGIRVEGIVTFLQSNVAFEVPQVIAPAKARTVMVKIIDDNGGDIDGHLHVDFDGDGKEERSIDFCTETADAIPIKPRSVLEVWVFNGTCNATPSLPTAGTIEFTFGR